MKERDFGLELLVTSLSYWWWQDWAWYIRLPFSFSFGFTYFPIYFYEVLFIIWNLFLLLKYADKCRYNNSASPEFLRSRRSSALRHCWKCKPFIAYWRCSHSQTMGSSYTLELAGIYIHTYIYVYICMYVEVYLRKENWYLYLCYGKVGSVFFYGWLDEIWRINSPRFESDIANNWMIIERWKINEWFGCWAETWTGT